jgi:hypothetical protein
MLTTQNGRQLCTDTQKIGVISVPFSAVHLVKRAAQVLKNGMCECGT